MEKRMEGRAATPAEGTGGSRPPGSFCSHLVQPRGTAGEVSDRSWGWGDPSSRTDGVSHLPKSPPRSGQLPGSSCTRTSLCHC